MILKHQSNVIYLYYLDIKYTRFTYLSASFGDYQNLQLFKKE